MIKNFWYKVKTKNPSGPEIKEWEKNNHLKLSESRNIKEYNKHMIYNIPSYFQWRT